MATQAAKTVCRWLFCVTVRLFRRCMFVVREFIFGSFALLSAYVNHGSYNIFVVDWGALCRAPCYVASVYNLKPVAKCLAQSFTFLRNSGMPVQKTTCVGHSLGAHICGLMANYLEFRIERIIGESDVDRFDERRFWLFCLYCLGLDPARPLIKPGIGNRLDSGDAKSVQVMHTNAGYYGEGGRVGHVDFCVNGGKRQPYCMNTASAYTRWQRSQMNKRRLAIIPFWICVHFEFRIEQNAFGRFDSICFEFNDRESIASECISLHVVCCYLSITSFIHLSSLLFLFRLAFSIFQIQICAVIFGPFAICRRAFSIIR